MKKILGFAIGISLSLFILLPWWLPDSWMYVEKGTPSKYVPLWNAWALVAFTLMVLFAINGIWALVDRINEWVSEKD